MANGSVALPRTLGRRLGSLPIALGGALGFIVCYGLNHSWKATLGAVFNKLSEISIPTGVFGALHPLGFLKTASDAIEKWFSDAQKFFEKGMVWGFTNFAMFWVLIGAAAFVFGEAIFELGEWTGAYISKVIRAQHLSRVVPTITKALREANARLDARLRSLGHSIAAARALATHALHVATHAIAETLPRLGRLERQAIDYTRLHKWLKRTLVGALGASIVLTALKRLGLGWVRCRNVTKAGKRICGLDGGLLDALLAATTLIVGTISLVEFAEEVGTVTEEASKLIHGFLRDA